MNDKFYKFAYLTVTFALTIYMARQIFLSGFLYGYMDGKGKMIHIKNNTTKDNNVLKYPFDKFKAKESLNITVPADESPKDA